MKKELNKVNKKLTLGKMTVAKLEKNQAKYIVGGDATTIKPKPASLGPGNENCTNVPLTVVE